MSSDNRFCAEEQQREARAEFIPLEIDDDFEFVFDFEMSGKENDRDVWYLIV